MGSYKGKSRNTGESLYGPGGSNREDRRKAEPRRSTSVFRTGGVCLAFLLIGYQAALFVHRATVLKIAQTRDHPDTVYVIDENLARRLLSSESAAGNVPGSGTGSGAKAVRGSLTGADAKSGSAAKTGPAAGTEPAASPGPGGNAENAARDADGRILIRRSSDHPEPVRNVLRNNRKVESFRFNPNTVSVGDLMRLGFSEKQAQSIDNYRSKGGRFYRKSDFARSYVVSDSVYRRLEKYIEIPKTDINTADSAAFDALPEIGPWFAKQMVSYREQLGGYSYKEQLMDIYRFDRQRFEAISDLVFCSEPEPFRLWSLPADSLRRHPYIKSWQAAKAIVLYRENTPASQRRVSALGSETGILPDSLARKLARCHIESGESP